jgi:hypothetical protein
MFKARCVGISKRFLQSRLPQNGICGVAARDADRHRKILFGDWTLPNFVAALALSDELTISC